MVIAFKINKEQFKIILKKNEHSKRFSWNLDSFNLIEKSGLTPVLLVNRWFISLQEETWVRKVFNIVPTKLDEKKFQKCLESSIF